MSYNSPKESFLQAVVIVVPATVSMIFIAWSGILDSATVELGLEHYAERRPPWFPKWIPMPLNTIINFGYIFCALYWCNFIRKVYSNGVMKDRDMYLFFVFGILGFLYGFIQLYRIIYQTRLSAIMDQWYTLPFFMLVFVWTLFIRGQFSWGKFYVFLSFSVSSYILTLLTTVGFEISLGCHIFLAVIGATMLCRQYPSNEALHYFALGVLNCCGFVILKLLDHHLPHIHWIFSYVSGHFLSKICDVLQLHYVNNFFYVMAINSARNSDLRKRSKQS